nr:Os01g0919150 [Ipomoea batatas]
MFVELPAAVAYKGVVVSFRPRKIPCIAKDRRTAGAPSALRVRYFRAGFNIGDSYLTPIKLKSGFARTMRITVWRRPRTQPIINAVDAEGICCFSRLTFPFPFPSPIPIAIGD